MSRIQLRRAGWLLFLLLLLGVSVGLTTAKGTVVIPLRDIGSIFFSQLPFLSSNVDPRLEAIVLHIRLPRVLVAALVGGGLALSGAVMQALFRNGLADPGILGVSSGGALGAVIALSFGFASEHIFVLPGMAFLGSLAAVSLVYVLASQKGAIPLSALLLSGLAVSALLSALTSLLLSLTRNLFLLRETLFWLMGGLDGRGWEHLRIIAIPVCLGSLLLLNLSRELNILISSGEESARTLGIDTKRLTQILLLLTSMITGVVVSVSGVIGFVGLVVPHVVRLLLGPDHRVLLYGSFLGGAIFLIWSDYLTRTLFPLEEIRLGVVTSFVGVPFFLYLLNRGRKTLSW
ncbi:MAG: iron ABC transporter permease [Deltaproteobacteria bacterium]|nr:iron ABC transporter permease [Deltaproteobacteria bacterium]